MNLFDTNAWYGSWAFAPVPQMSAAELVDELRRHGAGGALVSHFDCVFQFDPMPGNRLLAQAVRRQASLRPLPVLNLATPMWRWHLEELTAMRRVLAVRLLPAYHGYDISARKFDEAIEAIAQSGLRIVITARLIDERHEHPAIRIKPVPLKRVARFIERHPQVDPLIQGLIRSELEVMGKSEGMFCVDTSFLEWEDSLRVASGYVAVSRIQMGSTFPLQVLRSHVDKVSLSTISTVQRRLVAARNAQRFLGIPGI